MMRRYFRRLSFAFFLSLLGLLLTRHFFGSDGGSLRHAGEEPIAKLIENINEVQRKPLGKLVWETVTQGEDLFPGEDIRTSAASNAKIFLVQSKTVIELDPDSLIRLEKNPNGLALNFLEGNLLVKGAGEGVTLKTGNNAINLANADLTLSKTSGGGVDLEVLKGQAALMKDGKQVTLDKNTAGLLTEDGIDADKNRIRLIEPIAGEPVLLDLAKKEPIHFKWESLPAGYDVFIERGDNRNQLARGTSRQVSGESGELKVQSKMGKYYFRLVAIPKSPELPPLSSKVLALEILPKTAPVLLSPEEKEFVILEKERPSVALKWSTRMRFDSQVLEIARDSGLKQIVKRETLKGDRLEFELPWKEAGPLYWRVSGYLKHRGENLSLTSPIQNFTTKVGVDLIPPKLKSPLPDQHLTFQQITSQGLFLSWEPVLGISRYHVVVTLGKEAKPAYEREVTANPLRITGLGPGDYHWSVASILSETEKSAFSAKRPFVIQELPRIEWADGNSSTEHLYVTEKPSLDVAWLKTEAVSSWRVRVEAEGQEEGAIDSESRWHKTAVPRISTPVPADGAYEVEVEGLNDKLQVVARSSVKRVQVRSVPLLPAPQFASDLPEILRADRKGRTELNWLEVKGATKYRVLVRSENGQEIITTTNVERTVASLQKMKPGRYKVSLTAVDDHERPGRESSQRLLEVPDTSDIRAPKIKQFKVK